MFDKVALAQQKAEEIKTRLNAISVEGIAANGKVIVIANGNRKITDIQIQPELLQVDCKEELQDLLLIAIENAIEQAENISNAEMQSLMSMMLPGMGKS
jgi:DNA-binding YbaB/EbfC family protein